MSDTLKNAGASCPKCGDRCPAEYQQMGQAPRWTCHGCGATGQVVGTLSIAKPAAAPPAAPEKQAPPWARNLTKRRP